MSGGGGGGTSTTTQNIPKQLRPLVRAYTDKAIGMSDDPFQYYGRDRFADLNATQKDGLSMIRDRALGGSETIDNAEQNLNQMMSGGPNPYLDQMYGQAADAVKSNFTTAAVNSGSYGNSGLNEDYMQDLGGLAAQMYGGAYEGDQGRRMQAINMAPTFGNAAYQDAGQLLNAGGIQQDQAQQEKDFAFSQWTDKENLPFKQLAAMSGVFDSFPGRSTTTNQTGGGK